MRQRPLITALFAGLLLAAVALTAGTTSVAATVVNETAVDGAGNATDGGLAPIETTPDGESDNGSSTVPPSSQDSGGEDGPSDRERSATGPADAGEDSMDGNLAGTGADWATGVVPSPNWLHPGVDGLTDAEPILVLGDGAAPAIRDISAVPDGLAPVSTDPAGAGSGDQVHPFAATAGDDGEIGDHPDRQVSQRLAVPDGPGTGVDTRDEGTGPDQRSEPPVAVTGVAVLLVGLLGAPAAPELALATGRQGGEWLRYVGRVGSPRIGERLPLLPVGGYSRYDDSDPLANETRSAIHELVTDRPGIYHARLADETGVAVETVRYHARILAEEGLVEERTIRGRRRLFPVHREVEDHRIAAALADPDASDVLAAIERREPTTPSALAEALGRARSTVSYHLERLEEDGLVARERDGSGCLVRLRGTVRGSSEGVVTSD